MTEVALADEVLALAEGHVGQQRSSRCNFVKAQRKPIQQYGGGGRDV